MRSPIILACLAAALVLGLRALLRAATHIPAGDWTNRAIVAAVLMGAVANIAPDRFAGIVAGSGTARARCSTDPCSGGEPRRAVIVA